VPPPSPPPPAPTATPPANQPGIASGSGKPNATKVGQVTRAQIEEIAKKKLPDTNATKVDSVMKMIEGTARNMGLTVAE
jgi:large subunit ribosomal protein L11